MDTETGQGFIRQRRNLISISLVLFFYQVLGVEIKTLNIFGTTVAIHNSPYIVLVLWIICVYFLLRHYQYYKQINTGDLKEAFQTRMDKYVTKTAFEIFKKTYDPSKDSGRIPLPHEFRLIKRVITEVSPEKWTLYLETGVFADGVRESPIKSSYIVVKRKNLIWPFLKSCINLTFTTKFVTEYYLPFLLAYFSIVIQIYLWTNDFIRR